MSVVGNPWGTWVLCLAIALIALVRGTWSGTLVLALVVLAVVGAIVPPVGFLIGGVVVFYLVAVHGVEAFRALNKLLGGAP